MSNFKEIFQQTYGFEPPDKHESYEKKVSKLLLQSIGIANLASLVKAGEVQFNIPFVLEKYFDAELGLGVAKLDHDITLANLFSPKLHTSEIWKKYNEVQQNYPDAMIHALVFDKHGDGVGDLVLHNYSLFVNDNQWVFRFSIGKEGPFYIQPLKVFLEQLGLRYAQ